MLARMIDGTAFTSCGPVTATIGAQPAAVTVNVYVPASRTLAELILVEASDGSAMSTVFGPAHEKVNEVPPATLPLR